MFTAAILGQPLESISMDLEAHSVPGFFNALDGVFRGVHYNSDAEALIIVVDSDRTEPHELTHDFQKDTGIGCRHCKIAQIIARARNQLKPRQSQAELKIAIGLAVPSIEACAWLARTNRSAKLPGKPVGRQGVHRSPSLSSSESFMAPTDRQSSWRPNG
ncbi:MAG: hypothetical protein FJ271_27850 [Planctomycetes bacterium]|nr:hypothetical protein [Planctomycetota bacterium]